MNLDVNGIIRLDSVTYSSHSSKEWVYGKTEYNTPVWVSSESLSLDLGLPREYIHDFLCEIVQVPSVREKPNGLIWACNRYLKKVNVKFFDGTGSVRERVLEESELGAHVDQIYPGLPIRADSQGMAVIDSAFFDGSNGQKRAKQPNVSRLWELKPRGGALECNAEMHVYIGAVELPGAGERYLVQSVSSGILYAYEKDRKQKPHALFTKCGICFQEENGCTIGKATVKRNAKRISVIEFTQNGRSFFGIAKAGEFNPNKSSFCRSVSVELRESTRKDFYTL